MEDENAQNLLNNDENNNGEKEENKIEINSDNQNDNNKDEENNKNEIILNEEKNNINEIEINKEIDKNINQKDQIHINKDKDGEKNKSHDNKKQKSNIPLYVFSAKILEINSVKILIYFIKGSSVPKKIARSFKDIQLYQDYLRNSWPCIYIPNFPFREETIEENEKIVSEEKKMNLLNHFFKQIGETKHLLECEITKIFITKPGDFATEMSIVKKENYKDISEKYSQIFKDNAYTNKEIEEKEKFINSLSSHEEEISKNTFPNFMQESHELALKVNNFKKILDETFKQFIIIGATVLKEMFNIKREQNTIKFLTDMFVDLEQAMPNKKKRLTKANELVAPICSVSNIIYKYLIFIYSKKYSILI